MKITSLSYLLLIFCLPCYANSALSLCDKLNEVVVIPFKGEHVEDKVYNEVIGKGDNVLRCLIGKSVDITPMRDPRKSMPYEGFVVGDLAFFLFIEITKTNIEEFLPSSLSTSYKRDGVYAYFEYVSSKKNRR